jgi:hypothetical protein
MGYPYLPPEVRKKIKRKENKIFVVPKNKKKLTKF